MPKIVELPDGTELEFPDETTEAEMRAAIESMAAPAPAPASATVAKDAAQLPKTGSAFKAGRGGAPTRAPVQAKPPAPVEQPKPVEQPAPYRDKQEAVDDALNYILEGQKYKDVLKEFSKLGVTEQDLAKRGKELDHPMFRDRPKVDPKGGSWARAYGPASGAPATATAAPDGGAVQAAGNFLERARQNIGMQGDLLMREAGLFNDEQTAGFIAKRAKALDAARVSDETQAEMQAIAEAGKRGWGDLAVEVVKNPVGLFTMMADSVAQSTPGMVAGGLLSRFGPVGTAAGAGSTSFTQEYASTLLDAMAENGYSPADPERVARFLKDEGLMAAARERAVKRGIPVAAFDALSAGMAGRFVKAVEAKAISAGIKPGAREMSVAGLKEAGFQAGAGMAGEASAQLVDKGKIDDRTSILLEGLAEVPGSVPEIAGNLLNAKPAPQAGPTAADYQALVDKTFNAPSAVRPVNLLERAAAAQAPAAPVTPTVEAQPTTVVTPQEIAATAAAMPKVDEGKAQEATSAPAAQPINTLDPNDVLSTLGLNGGQPVSVPGAPAGSGRAAARSADAAAVPGLRDVAAQPGAGAGAAAVGAAGEAGGVGAARPSSLTPVDNNAPASFSAPLPLANVQADQRASQSAPGVPDLGAGSAGDRSGNGPGLAAANAERVAAANTVFAAARQQLAVQGRLTKDTPLPDLTPADEATVASFSPVLEATAEALGTDPVALANSKSLSDGVNWVGRAIVNLDGLQKPAAFVAVHESIHSIQNLARAARRAISSGAQPTTEQADALRIWEPMELAIWDMVPTPERTAYAADALGVSLKEMATWMAEPDNQETLRREFMADFGAKRLTSKEDVQALAQREPKLFGDFARRMIDGLSKVIATLRGKRGGLGVNDVDRHIKDLAKAKLMWQDALVAWKKRGGAAAAPQTEQPSHSARLIKDDSAPSKDKPITLVFGGTFNPVHAGHVQAALDARQMLLDDGYSVERVVVSPSPQSLMRKKAGADASLLKDRVAMLKRAFEGVDGIEVTDTPSRLADESTGKPNRNAQSDWVQAQYPGTTVVNVAGQDTAPDGAPGFPSLYAPKSGNMKGYFYLAVARDEVEGISSSKIRKMVEAGEEVPADVSPPEVTRYFKATKGLSSEVAIDGVIYDGDAADFGVGAPPRTLPDGHPLLRSTDTLDVAPTADGGSEPRSEMVKRIVSQAFEGKSPATGRPIAYVMGGGGASGKGTLKRILADRGLVDAESSVDIDPDDVKLKIPEYSQILAAGDSRAADRVHNESSDIGEQITQRAIEGGYNIILDKTLSNPDKAAKALNELRERGYEVRLFGVTIDPATAVVRAAIRAKNTARHVPTDVLLKAHQRFTPNFERIAEAADTATLFDSTDGFLPIAEMGSNGLRILEPMVYNQAVEKTRAINEQATTLNAIVGRSGDGQVRQGERGAADPQAQADRAGRSSESSADEGGGGGDSGGRGATEAGVGRDGRGLQEGRSPLPVEGSAPGTRSLYISRPVVNAQEIILWARSLGIKNLVPAGSMHVTLAYSRDAVDPASLPVAPERAETDRGSATLSRYSDGGAVSLRLDAPELVARHEALKAAGVPWQRGKGNGFVPHITLSYRESNSGDVPVGRVFPGKVVLGPEKMEPLRQGWRPDEAPSASGRTPSEAPASQFDITTLKEGSLRVLGDVEAIRAALPDDVKGRKIPGGMLFSPSAAPRAKAALEGRKLAYSRAGQVIDKLPMKDGKYVGAPEKFNTPQKISKLRKILRQLAEEGAPGRFWYENSSKEVLQMVGGDVNEARKFVALLAIYSPQAKVDTNSTFALRAWSQYKAGQPINVKTKVMDDKATAALSDIDAFWSGEKTGNFFNNLLREIDPSVADKQGATIDMWMMRAAQYVSDAPTATQYAFMENENNRIAKELGWEPQQVQAAIWVAMKARTENKGVKEKTEALSEQRGWIRFDNTTDAKGKPKKVRVILDAQKHRDNWLKHAMEHDVTKSDTQTAKFDFSDGLRRHIGQISWEARPGRSTGVLPGVNDAPYDQQVEFQQAVQKALYSEEGADLLAQQLGLLVDGPDILAPGVWQGEVAAGMQKQVAMAPGKGEDGKSIDPTQKQSMDVYAATLGLLLRQEGVGWHRPFYKGLKSAENGIELQIGRPFTPEEAQALWGATDAAMREAGVADWEQGAGLISSPAGMRLVNFGAVDNNTKFRDLIKTKVVPTLPFDSVESIDFSSDGNLVTNDWKAAPNGQTYRQGISEAGRSDLLGWSRDVLAPRIQAVFDEFSSKYGWGEPGRIEDLFDGPSFSGRPDAAGDRRDRGVSEGPEQGGPSYGVATPGAAAPVEAYHFSRQQRSSLSSGAYGSGLRGAEMERVMRSADTRLRQRVYFYVNQGTGIRPESGVGGYAHRVTLNNLYDTAKGEIKGVGNDFESAVLDAGYDGYVVRLPGAQSGQAVLLGAHNVPVEYLGMGSGAIAQPAAVSQAGEPSSRMQGDALVSTKAIDPAAVRAKAEIQAVAPSFRFEFGKAKVNPAEAEVANAALEAAGSDLSFSRRLSPQSALDAAIDRATVDLDEAIRLKRKTVGLGRTPHVINMLGAKPMLMAIDPSIIDKIFAGKHADELRGVPLKDVVTGLYRPAMIFKHPSYPNDYELVLPVPTKGGPLTAIIVANPADGEARIKSIYARSWKVREELDGKKHPNLSDFTGGKVKSKMVYFDEYSAPIAVTGNKAIRTEADRKVARPGSPLNKEHYLSYADFAVKDRADRRAAKTEDDLLRWIGDNYTGDPADAPSFSQRRVDTPEFKRWFGDSKVVDDRGRPLVMYHGTGHDFSSFKIGTADAIFLSPTPQFANEFAMRGMGKSPSEYDQSMELDGLAPNVMPVYVAAKDIFDLDNADHRKELARELTEASYVEDDGDTFEAAMQGALQTIEQRAGDSDNWDFLEQTEIQSLIRSMGFDSFYVRENGVKNLGVYKSAQIKSAIGNNGQFDPANADISMSRRQPSTFRDELGRFRLPTGPIADKIGQAINRLLTGAKLNYASPEFRRQLRAMKLELQKAQDVAVGVAQQMSQLSAGDRTMISAIVEKELAAGIAPPQHAVQIANGISQIMEQQTNELIALGMLSTETADRLRGKYLPRFYESKMRPSIDKWAQAAKALFSRQPVMAGIKGKRLKGRGLWETTDASVLKGWEALGWEVRDPNYVPGQKSGPVQIWRDFTREERDQMGEVRDAGFRFVMGYTQAQRDIALGRMFQGIAANPSMASATEKADWVRVPDGTVDGTGAKRYGMLSGMWVSPEVFNHLETMDQMAGPAMKAYRKAMSMWKEGKTVLNPVSHANNVLSNLSMAHFAGVSYWDAHKYAGAIMDLARGRPMVQEAKDAGLFLGTMSQEELTTLLPPELRSLAKQQEGKVERSADFVWNMLSWWLRRPMGKAYEAEDLFFRYLIYRDARGRGLDPQDAVDYAQRYIFTYDDLPKNAQRIRDFGLPFFAYTFKVVPALLHTAAHYPHRMLAPAALLYGLNMAMYAIAAGEDDEDWVEKIKAYLSDSERRKKADELEASERENLPPWMKGSVSIGAPKAVRLGVDEALGLPLFWDVAQIMPGGNLFDVSNNLGGISVPQSLMPSHPLWSTALAMMANKDAFFGKPIVDENDTSAEAAQKRGEWIWRQVTPAIAAGNYHWERAMNVLAQVTGEPVALYPWRDATGVGKDGLPVDPGTIALNTVGIKVRPIDLERSAEMAEAKRQALIRDIDKELRLLRRQNQAGFLSDANFEAAQEQAQLKKERLREGLTVDGDKPK